MLRVDARKDRKIGFNLARHSANSDTEHTLATLDKVKDIFGTRAFVDRGAVAHERDLCEVVGAARTHGIDGDADLLERDTRVEESLDDLEHQDVAEAVEAL